LKNKIFRENWLEKGQYPFYLPPHRPGNVGVVGAGDGKGESVVAGQGKNREKNHTRRGQIVF